MTNVLLISNSISDYQIFIDSINSNTLPIVYSSSSTKDDILSLLKTNFSKISRIGIACEIKNDSETIFLDNLPFFTDSETPPYSENLQFLINLINEFNVKNLDFLACNSLNFTDWNNYYKLLTDNTNVIIGASNDNTGNIKYGGDWVLESTNEDIEFIYFTKSIEYYKYLLALVALGLGGQGGTLGTLNSVGSNTVTVAINYAICNNTSGFLVNLNTYPTTANKSYSTAVNGFLIGKAGVTVGPSSQSGNTVSTFTATFFIPIGTSPTVFYLLIGIGDYAFINITSFTNFTCNNGGDGSQFCYIGDYAFSGCTGLTTFNIPPYNASNVITYIGNYAFNNCNKLSSFTIPYHTNYQVVSDYAFNNCTTTTFTITKSTVTPFVSSVLKIGNSSFANCAGFTNINFNDIISNTSFAVIGSNAFEGCTGLNGTITIPSWVTNGNSSISTSDANTNFGSAAFKSCTNITGFTFPTASKFYRIPDNLLYGCIGLNSTIIIPNSVTTIGSNAFNFCTNLPSINFSNTTALILIDSFSFQSCTKLFETTNSESIFTIPNSVTTINQYAFKGCTTLKKFTFPTNPNFITISNNVLEGCTGLTSIIIPATVTTINANAFYGCTNLTSVTFAHTTKIPTIDSTAFSNIGTKPIAYYNYGVINYGALTSVSGFSFAVALNVPITNYSGPVVCFKEDSKILTNIGYIKIQNLRPGHLIKTLNNGYVPINMIGKREMYHVCEKHRIKDQLYKCSKNFFPEIFEDLIITGCHCILVDDYKNEDEINKTIKVNGNTYVTDNKWRLPACVDERTTVYETPGTYMIYHLALDNDDYYKNYGIYANGLLVETCSKRFLKELSNMTLIT